MTSSSSRSWDILSQHLLKTILSLILLTHPAQAILDTNSNTLSDLWEKQYNNQQLFPATAGNLPEDDSDGDGWTNAQEAAAGTDPKEANPPDGIIRTQLFRFPATSFIDPEDGTEYTTPEAFEITWPTLTGKQYTLIASENLTFQSWISIGPPFIATGGITTITVPVTQPDGSVPTKLFWRIAVQDIDTDSDGLTNHEEHLIGTNPAATDSDFDGLTDHAEMLAGLNPNHPDYDLDGILDGSDSTPFANNAIANPDGENLSASLTTKLTGRWDLETINVASGIRTTPNVITPLMPAKLGGAIAADHQGMVSKATRMSGINQYLRTDPSTIATRASFSISLWFRFEKNYIQNKSSSLNTVLFAYNDVLDATPLFQLHAYKAIPTSPTQKLVFSHYSNGSLQPDIVGDIPLSAVLDDGKWQHLTLTKSAGTFRIYRNSQQVISGNGHPSIWETGANAYLCFGALAPATSVQDTNFRGSMDRICTWSEALDLNEVATLYRQDIDRDGLWDITESATRYSDYQSAIPYHPLPNDPNAPQPTQTGYARSPYLYSNSNLDFDQDELNDLAEQAAGTRLTDPDTDQDNLTDGFEVTYNFNPLTAYSLGLTNTSDDQSDPDSDNLTTLIEYLNGSNPRNPNTDGDATPDAIEINQGSDPANAADSGAAPTDPPYQVPIHINGDYTAWEATVKGKGPKDTRTRRFRMSDHNVPADETLELLRGNAYELTLRYIRSKPGESVPWYCWEASINGDTSPVFIAGDQWIVDNTAGLLAEHTHSHGTNQIAEKKVDFTPIEFEVKHTEIDPATGQVVNPGVNTMLRDEVVDIRIKVPPIGAADLTVDLTIEPEAMRTQVLSNRGVVKMYDFGQVEANGTIAPDKTQFVLQASAGGERTIKAVFNKEGTLEIKMKSTDGKIDFTSPDYTIQKRMRKYASLPSSQNHDLNQHDKALVDAANHWGGVYQHPVDDVERLKAMGMAESDLGITDAVDILTVGNNNDFVIPRLKGQTSGVKLNGTTETWTKEFEFLPNGAGGYTPSYYNYQDASKTSAPIAIKWGTCWFYKKAMISSLDPNGPPTYSKFDSWRTWESATTRYNGGGVNNYLERVDNAMKEGKHPTTPNLFLWPLKSNNKARGN